MPLKRLRELNTRECLWIYILRLLLDKPMHAYAIREQIRKRFGFMPGTVTAYKVLYLLNRGGLVSKKSEGRQKVYTITPTGRDALKKAVNFYMERAKVLGE
jgi:DNA-binding PadR family transcriptional regulator